jgi:hypothetical protein
MKTAVFIYYPAQIEGLLPLLARLQATDTCTVIACGADIEFLLEEKNVSYVSAKSLKRTSSIERLVVAKKIGEEILRSPAFSFFNHRSISLGRIYTPPLQYYLAHFLYYLDIVASALEEKYDRVVLYSPPVQEILAAGVLEKFSTASLEDAVRLICKEHIIRVDIISPSKPDSAYRILIRRSIFDAKRALFGWALSVQNAYVHLTVPKKKICILASEYWKNVAPLMSKLSEAELLLVDRSEAFAMGLGNILRYRAQFVHSDAFVRSRNRKAAQEKTRQFMEEWLRQQEQNKALREATFRGYSLVPVLEPVLLHLIRMSERLMRDIDGSWTMVERLAPDVVLVRASISAQTHFAVLCEVARLQGIPSIENQHGVLSIFEGDFTNNPFSEYIAEYGPIVRKELEKHHYAPRSKFVDIGSPRFDIYIAKNATQERKPDGEFRVLHFAPAFAPGSWNDTYDVVDYYNTIAAAVRGVPNIHLVLKLRPGPAGEKFFREVIKRSCIGVPHTIAQFEPLVDLLQNSDAVVSYHSTALLEALLSHRPVVYDATMPIYSRLADVDLAPHQEAGALVVARTQETLASTLLSLSLDSSLRRQLSARAEEFMRKNYQFHDGKSSERLAEEIRVLAKARK